MSTLKDIFRVVPSYARLGVAGLHRLGEGRRLSRIVAFGRGTEKREQATENREQKRGTNMATSRLRK
jgi:hypothetical protein